MCGFIKNRGRRLTLLLLCFCAVLPAGFAHGEERFAMELHCGEYAKKICAVVERPDDPILPSYKALRLRWEEAAVKDYLGISVWLTGNERSTWYDLEEGRVLLFSETEMERIAFLHSPAEMLHYMTGRSDAFYGQANNGLYRQVKVVSPSMKDVFAYQNSARDMFSEISEFLALRGVEIGSPFEMTGYYLPDNAGMGLPEEIVAAFPRRINGIRLMPWGQRLPNGDYTYPANLVLYLDSAGIADLQLPMILERPEEWERREVLTLEAAAKALEALLNDRFVGVEPPDVDYIVLEYAPIQRNSGCDAFQIIPVWSFYANYASDDARTVISLNAFTGEQVF